MSLLPYIYDFERPIRLLERPFFRPDEFFNHPYAMMPRNFFEPHFGMWNNIMKPMEQLITTMNRLGLNNDVSSNITADDEKFQVNVDVQHFKPEEVSVKVVDGQVVVHGKHEEKPDEHGYISRQFVRKYVLPKGCLPDTVESTLSSDGVLTITAPRVLPLPSTGEKIIPITHTGPVQKKYNTSEEIK